MKAISDATLDALEDVALESVRQLKLYFTSDDNDQKQFQKARIAATTISSYARVRASETNRMAISLASSRLSEPLRLPDQALTPITELRD